MHDAQKDVQYLFLLSVLILLTLFIRDLPYINVLIISKIWIVYLLVLLVIFLYKVNFNVRYVLYSALLFFIFAFFLTVLSLSFFSEGAGVILYFSLWIVLIHKLVFYIKEKK